MGVRGEVFSTKVALQNRTYFFNVKENRLGDLYLNIVESKNRDEGGFDRQSVILFADDLQDFLQGFDESLRVLEKAAREKRRGKKSNVNQKRSFAEKPGGSSRSRNNSSFSHDGSKSRERGRKSEGTGRIRQEKKESGQRGVDKQRGFAKQSGNPDRKPPGDFPPRKKRVVVKKR